MPTITKGEKEMCQPRFKNNLCENLIQKFHNTVVLFFFNSLYKIVTPLVVISTAKQDAKSFPPRVGFLVGLFFDQFTGLIVTEYCSPWITAPLRNIGTDYGDAAALLKVG